MPITIRPFCIYKCCVLYLVIPILFFFLGWLKLGIGLLLSFLLLLSSAYFLRKVKSLTEHDGFIVLSKDYYVAFIILFLFLLSTGNTGFVGSWGYDIPWRNAIYQDLVHQSWPVLYTYSHSMLCYYMVFWLVPAEITSLLGLNEVGSNIVLFVWMYIGLLLLFFLLCDILRVRKEHVIITVIVFCFFSGINTFGMILKSVFVEPTQLIGNFPGWAGWEFTNFNINGIDIVFLMRSTYLNIADIYNQYFAIAISTLMFFRFRRHVEFYVFIGLLVLPFSPIGFIGMFVIECLEWILNARKNVQTVGVKAFIKESFSKINILALLAIVPVFYLYYSMNVHASNLLNYESSMFNSFLYIPLDKFSGGHAVILVLYYYFYFLIYARLIYDRYKRESVFWEILFCLILFPFFRIGNSADFNFNATICPYLLLCVLIIKYLLESTYDFKVKDFVLVFFLSVAMLTPITQMASSFRGAYLNDKVSYKWSPWASDKKNNTFSDKEVDILKNFLITDFERKMFFLHFSKK